MTTRVTEGARRERHEKRESLFSSRAAALVSRGLRLRRSRTRALLSLNLKKKRDCSQSRGETVVFAGYKQSDFYIFIFSLK